MENSYRFFANRDCRYYPCHPEMEEMNCLFCYCPFYAEDRCPGAPVYAETGTGGRVKDCSGCCFPHRPENYDAVIRLLGDRMTGGKG